MDKVKIEKVALREIVQKNRDEHRTIFEEAVEGYKKKAVELLEAHIERIKKGAVEQINVRLPTPKDHTSDYDRVLRMIDLSVDGQLELDERRFSEYVMDDWDWQRGFLTETSAYTASAIGKSERMSYSG
jgi:hypothetical protein